MNKFEYSYCFQYIYFRYVGKYVLCSNLQETSAFEYIRFQKAHWLGAFLRITFFKPIGQTCEGRCGTWFFNKSHGIYPGDHFAKMSLHAFQSLFSKVDFSKVAQQCHIDIFVYRGNLSNSTQCNEHNKQICTNRRKRETVARSTFFTHHSGL